MINSGREGVSPKSSSCVELEVVPDDSSPKGLLPVSVSSEAFIVVVVVAKFVVVAGSVKSGLTMSLDQRLCLIQL